MDGKSVFAPFWGLGQKGGGAAPVQYRAEHGCAAYLRASPLAAAAKTGGVNAPQAEGSWWLRRNLRAKLPAG